MLQLHSASDDTISYLQNFAKERGKRKKQKTSDDSLQQKIEILEKKLADYEKRKMTALYHIIDMIAPPSERIKALPIHKRLNFLE